MKEILDEHQKELKKLNKYILLLEQKIKDNAKEKGLIEHELKQLEQQNKDMKELHQKEKYKLQKEIEDHMGDIADMNENEKEYVDEIKKIKEINEELLKEKEELKNMNNLNITENQNLRNQININTQKHKELENMYNSNLNEKDKTINQINNSLYQKEKEIENKYNSILAENNNKITKTQISLLQKNHEIDSQNKRINKLLNQKKKMQVSFHNAISHFNENNVNSSENLIHERSDDVYEIEEEENDNQLKFKEDTYEENNDDQNMNIKNEQLQEIINELNTYPKNKYPKKEPEYSLEEYGKEYNSNLKANLAPNTTTFNKFLKNNKAFDTYYEKNQSYYNFPKSTDVSYPKHVQNKLTGYRFEPGGDYITNFVFGPDYNNKINFNDNYNRIDFSNKISNDDFFNFNNDNNNNNNNDTNLIENKSIPPKNSKFIKINPFTNEKIYKTTFFNNNTYSPPYNPEAINKKYLFNTVDLTHKNPSNLNNNIINNDRNENINDDFLTLIMIIITIQI
jgi:hypothetical protein